jgi:putative sterol carrier protein
MVEVEELLKSVVEKFNTKVREDTALKNALKDIKRTVQIELTDGKMYKFMLNPNGITDFSEGIVKNADVRVISDTETLKALINKQIGPMKAWMTGRLRIKASFTDLAMLRKFIAD